MTRWMLVFVLAGCGGQPAPAPPRPADYGTQVVTDMKAFADRECQCSEKIDEACSKQNSAERDTYYKKIDRSRPFSGEENASIDADEKRFHDCAKTFDKIILE
jgi:hypothetical protein